MAGSDGFTDSYPPGWLVTYTHTDARGRVHFVTAVITVEGIRDPASGEVFIPVAPVSETDANRCRWIRRARQSGGRLCDQGQ